MNLEELIDKKLELFSTESKSNEVLIESVENRFEVFFDYLQAEYAEDLNDEEFEMLLFPQIISLLCAIDIDDKTEFDPEVYVQEEEYGFKLLEEHNTREVFNFSYDFKYLDLIYFVEDYLDGMDEEGISKVVQNIIYVVSTSLLKAI